MENQYDFKKEWESTKQVLMKFSKEAVTMAKKGEEELVKFSKKANLYVNAKSMDLQKEKLIYQIGREYVKSLNEPTKPNSLDKIVKELNVLEKKSEALKQKIKMDNQKKKTTKKTSKAKEVI